MRKTLSSAARKLAISAGIAAIALTSAAANANTYKSFLEYSAVGAFGGNLTSNTAPYFGEVTLTEGGSGTGAYVDVTVNLFSGFKFIDTGNDGKHTPFAFNLTAPGLASVININPSPPWHLNPVNPTLNAPFGTFTTGLDCCAQNGAAGGTLGPLSFRVTSTNGITFFGVGGYWNSASDNHIGTGDRFRSNTDGSLGGLTGGWWFVADVVGPDGSSTGMIAARDLENVSAIPEPDTYAMLLAGLGIMGFMARRRIRDLTSFS